MSWEEIDELTSEEQAAAEEVPARDKQILSAVFNTEHGPEALRILQSWTVNRPSFPSPDSCADGVMVSQLMCIREGENNLYRRIRACVAKPDVALPIKATLKPERNKENNHG